MARWSIILLMFGAVLCAVMVMIIVLIMTRIIFSVYRCSIFVNFIVKVGTSGCVITAN